MSACLRKSDRYPFTILFVVNNVRICVCQVLQTVLTFNEVSAASSNLEKAHCCFAYMLWQFAGLDYNALPVLH